MLIVQTFGMRLVWLVINLLMKGVPFLTTQKGVTDGHRDTLFGESSYDLDLKIKLTHRPLATLSASPSQLRVPR